MTKAGILAGVVAHTDLSNAAGLKQTQRDKSFKRKKHMVCFVNTRINIDYCTPVFVFSEPLQVLP